jgi:hypothetical protein
VAHIMLLKQRRRRPGRRAEDRHVEPLLLQTVSGVRLESPEYRVSTLEYPWLCRSAGRPFCLRSLASKQTNAHTDAYRLADVPNQRRRAV